MKIIAEATRNISKASISKIEKEKDENHRMLKTCSISSIWPIMFTIGFPGPTGAIIYPVGAGIGQVMQCFLHLCFFDERNVFLLLLLLYYNNGNLSIDFRIQCYRLYFSIIKIIIFDIFFLLSMFKKC